MKEGYIVNKGVLGVSNCRTSVPEMHFVSDTVVKESAKKGFLVQKTTRIYGVNEESYIHDFQEAVLLIKAYDDLEVPRKESYKFCESADIKPFLDALQGVNRISITDKDSLSVVTLNYDLENSDVLLTKYNVFELKKELSYDDKQRLSEELNASRMGVDALIPDIVESIAGKTSLPILHNNNLNIG